MHTYTIIVSRELPVGPVESVLVVRPLATAMLGMRFKAAVQACYLNDYEAEWYRTQVAPLVVGAA